jgi:uncharacterized protein YjbJ (UPF0337 family)
MSETGSGSGYDSASEMARGQTKEAAGKLIHDKAMEEEGKTEQASATAKERGILKYWRHVRNRRAPAGPST